MIKCLALTVLLISCWLPRASAGDLREFCSTSIIGRTAITRVCAATYRNVLKDVVFFENTSLRNLFQVAKSDYKGTTGFNGESYPDPDLGGLAHYVLTLLQSSNGSSLSAKYIETYTRGPAQPVEIEIRQRTAVVKASKFKFVK